MNVTMRFPLCGDKPVIPRSFGTHALSIWQKHIKPQFSNWGFMCFCHIHALSIWQKHIKPQFSNWGFMCFCHIHVLSIWQKHIKPQLENWGFMCFCHTDNAWVGHTRIVTRIVTRAVTLKYRDVSHNLVDHLAIGVFSKEHIWNHQYQKKHRENIVKFFNLHYDGKTASTRMMTLVFRFRIFIRLSLQGLVTKAW